MKISVRAHAFTVDAESELEIIAPPDLNGWRCEGANLADYLDPPLADLGVVGGEVRAENIAGVPMIVVDFWSPSALGSEMIAELKDFVSAQLDDGFGEGGFRFPDAYGNVLLLADTERPLVAEQVHDGRVVQRASRLVIAARDGDLDAVRSAIESHHDLRAKLQGHDALQMAILYGHREVAELLISAGADVHSVTSTGDSTLDLCTLSRSLNDEDSARLARRLVVAGADAMTRRGIDQSAAEYAFARRKTLTEAVLRGTERLEP